LVSETLEQGRTAHRAGSMIVSTAVTFVVLAGIIAAPALVVGFAPGTPADGPALPALELGWSGPAASDGLFTSGEATGTGSAPLQADVPTGTPGPAPEATALQPAALPQQEAATAPPPDPAVAQQPPMLAALPAAAEVVEDIITAPKTADAAPAPDGGTLLEEPDEQDMGAPSEDDEETELVPEDDDPAEPTDGADQNTQWLDTDEPTGLLNLLLRDGNARPSR
jgi:hypothetical protein